MKAPSQDQRQSTLSQEIRIPLSALQLGQLLGEGGFGKVFAGQWRPTALYETPVAIKQLKEAHLTEQVQSEFEAEVAVHAKLKSPGIVQLYGVTLEQPYCMVMEYMPNQSLDKYLQNNKRETVSWTVRIQLAQDIAVGLDYLHSQLPPIIHADIKSLNVLLDRKNRAKLADFGLASIKKETASKVQSASKMTTPGQPQGSLLWMAPELFRRGVESTALSDVYAYGMVLWEISAHQYPFATEAHKGPEIIKDFIREGDLDPFPKETPASYQALGDSCRSREKDQRPTAAKLLEMLGLMKGSEANASAKLSPAKSGKVPALPAKPGKALATQSGSPYLLQQTNPAAVRPASGNSPYLNNVDSAPSSKPIQAAQAAIGPYMLDSAPRAKEPNKALKGVGLVKGPIKQSPVKSIGGSQAEKLAALKTQLKASEEMAAQAAQGAERERREAEEIASLGAQLKATERRRIVLGGLKAEMSPGQHVDQQAREVSLKLKPKKVLALLTCVMRGDLEGVEGLLASNKALVYAQGDITDLSKRTFARITVFQYAVWALDKPMWDLILRYLPKESAAAQLQALESERADIRKAHGTNYNFEELFNKTRWHYDHLCEWAQSQRATYWLQEVGGAQRQVPAWLVLMWCERGRDSAWAKQPISQGFRRDLKHLSWWFDGKLGEAWAPRVRGSSPSASKAVGGGPEHCLAIGNDMVFLQKLVEAQSHELAELKTLVYQGKSPLMGN
jgi:serine/threonine protein kinase